MGKMKEIDLMIQNMKRDPNTRLELECMEQESILAGALASCLIDQGLPPASYMYEIGDVIETFGPNFAMFGELMVGQPECEFCLDYEFTQVPATHVRHVAAIEPDGTRHSAVVFNCDECEKEW